MDSFNVSSHSLKMIDWKFSSETATSACFSLPAPYEEKEAFLAVKKTVPNYYEKPDSISIHIELNQCGELPDDVTGKMDFWKDGAFITEVSFNPSVRGRKTRILNIRVKQEQLDQWRSASGQIHIKLALWTVDETPACSNSGLALNLRSAFDLHIGSDFTIVVGKKQLKVSKFVLMAHSPVFQRMIETDLSESKEGRVEITDMDFVTMQSLVKFIYHFNIGELGWNEAAKLLAAANKYDIDSLRSYCSKMIARKLTDENVFEAHQLADQCKAFHLILVCVKRIAKLDKARLLK